MSIKTTVDKVADVLKNIKQMQSARVMVGIPKDENARSDGLIGNASIGYIQENGSPAKNIPARPFLIPGVEAVKNKVADILGEGAKNVLDGGSITGSQTKAGIVAQNSVKATITAGEGFTTLADSTLAARQRKGVKGTKPLIRTGQLRNSITYIVKGA